MFVKAAAPFAVALAILAASPAAVQAAGLEQPSVKVTYSDLNLATAEGQANLQARLQHAATTVCGGDEGRRSLGEELNYKACRADSVTDGLAKVQQTASSTVASK
jgi:UrcA family protein